MTLFGLDTFGDVTVDADGIALPHGQVVRNVIEEAVLADRVGVDAIGLGEHHRDDYAISAPDVVLAAAAARTERIVLGTAVTVLSSDDPVRAYERFATVDAIARATNPEAARVEVTMGRGSFTESFPLFGFDLADYERLFEEKLDLWARLQGESEVNWQGTVRGPLRDARVFPRTTAGHIPTWVGVGGSPESVVRTARFGFGLMLAIIGGEPARFAPYVDLYHRALSQFEQPELPVGVHSPGFIADTDEEAREILFPHFKANRDRIGRERGWGPATRAQFDEEAEVGSLYVGSPETVAQRIAETVRTLGVQRFDLKYSNGPLPHPQLMHAIELYGTVVIPRVRELLGEPDQTSTVG